MLNELSLFSGYSGMTLGLRLAGLEVRTVGYCEIEPYCQELLRRRIRDGFLDWAPIITNINGADFRPMAGLVDIITAGFPCQPHSKAGRRLGKEDKRNLWPDTLRVIRDVGPRYVLLENVQGLADGADPYAAEIIGQLSEVGMDAVWGLHSAAEAGAPHLRRRWWCLAYTHSDGERSVHPESGLHPAEGTYEPLGDAGAVGEQVPHSIHDGLHKQEAYEAQPSGHQPKDWLSIGSGPWGVESGLDRVVDGVADRVDRIRALGNGVVPAVVARFLT